MKKVLMALIVLFIGSISQLTAQLALGGGVAFTTNTNDVGVQLKSQYAFGSRWRAEASVDGYTTGQSRTFYGDFNLNGNFIYANSGNVELHAVLGGTVFFGSTSNLGFVQKGSALGINAGTGMQFGINNQLKGYLDAIFTFTDYGHENVANRFLFALGVIYEFNQSSIKK